MKDERQTDQKTAGETRNIKSREHNKSYEHSLTRNRKSYSRLEFLVENGCVLR